MLKDKTYSKREFKKWVLKNIDAKNFEKAYQIYQSKRDNKKENIEISIESVEKLLIFLEKEIKVLS